MENLQIVQVGLGPLGLKIVRALAARSNLTLVGAVDTDPALLGRGLKDLSVEGIDLPVSGTLGEILIKEQVDAVIVATVSDMERITPQIEEIVAAGLPVVSTCEELSYPWQTSPLLASRIDVAAKEKQVAVLGTGVNPGFLMDALPVTLSSVCQRIDSVKISRIQNAAFRRLPFQKKIGAGLSLAEFDLKKQDGSLRHVGLTESMYMIAAGMGWQLERTEDSLIPVIAEDRIVTESLTIEAGQAAGVQQIGIGYQDGEARITLVFRAAVGEPKPMDAIDLQGDPSFSSRIDGGINGDIATCAIVLNALHRIAQAPPGLHTMIDLPPLACFA